MSYTFTSPIKNYANNETLDKHPDMKENLDTIFENAKTILMVGWRHDSDHSFIKYMVDKGKKVNIVEIFEPNIKNIPQGVTVDHANILTYEVKQPYDLFLWQGGPEHVTIQEATDLFKRIEKHFKYLIIETPNGYNFQDEMYGNVYEKHVSHWEPKDYEACGFLWRPYAGKDNDAFLVGYKSMVD